MASSFVRKLTKEQKDVLDNLIRSNQYGHHDAVVEALASYGIKTSKSSVHRYASSLKEKDGIHGQAGSNDMLARSSSPGGHLASLYQKLGELEYQKQMIIDEIKEIEAGAE